MILSQVTSKSLSKNKSFYNNAINKNNAKENLKENLLILIIRSLFINWYFLFKKLFSETIKILGMLNTLQFLYISSSFLLIFFSLLPWFNYNLEFYTTPQQISSTSRGLFFLLSLNNLLVLFFQFYYKQIYALLIILINISIYIYGFFDLKLVHLNLLNTEFNYNTSIWAYGICLFLSLISSVHTLNNPIISKGTLKKYLLSIPKINDIKYKNG